MPGREAPRSFSGREASGEVVCELRAFLPRGPAVASGSLGENGKTTRTAVATVAMAAIITPRRVVCPAPSP